jgi:hypothetical protein
MKELEFFAQESSQGLLEYAAEISRTYNEKKAKYDAAVKERNEDNEASAVVTVPVGSKALRAIEEPLPANKIALYQPDIFGLELAARDCRFEMIKIVREVCK